MAEPSEKKFSVKDHSWKTRQIQSTIDKELGLIAYGLPTAREMLEIAKTFKADLDRANNILLLVLQKGGQKDLTINEIEALPANVHSRLCKIFAPYLEKVGDDGTVRPVKAEVLV